MDRREIAFDPSILSIIADQRQLTGEPVTLGQVCNSGTHQLWRKARDSPGGRFSQMHSVLQRQTLRWASPPLEHPQLQECYSRKRTRDD